MQNKIPMTKIESDIYHLILENPMLSQNELAQSLNMSRTAVSVHISNLIKKGYIIGRSYVLGEFEPVVLIGAAMVDLYGVSTNPLIDKDSNPGEVSFHAGGVSRNIAENLSRIGIQTSLITSLAQDPFSEIIRKNCLEVGINISHSYENLNDPTTMYVALIEPDGDMRLALSDTSALDAMPISHLKSKDAILKQADILIIDASLPKHLVQYILEKYPNHSVILDPVSIGKATPLKDLIGKFHTVKCNQLEASLLSGVHIDTQEDVIEASKTLLNKGCKQVFITLGEQGVYFANNQDQGFLASKATKIVNVTGAGDAFTAGIVYGMLEGLNIKEIANFASMMSAYSLSSMETVNPNLNINEIKKELEKGERI